MTDDETKKPDWRQSIKRFLGKDEEYNRLRDQRDAQWELKNGPIAFRGSDEGKEFAKERIEFYKTATDNEIEIYERRMRNQYGVPGMSSRGFKVEPYLAALREVRTRANAGDEIDFLERLLKLQPSPEQNRTERG